MSGNKEYGYDNTENPYELFKAAQRDIITINSEIKNEDFRFEDKVETICRCAAEAVEKMLKGWIINNDKNIKVYGIHNLDELYNKTININSLFSELEDKMNFLNNYTTGLRYNSRFNIEPHEVKQCLKNLKQVYDFHLIKEARNNIDRDNKFNVLPDDIGKLFGNYYE